MSKFHLLAVGQRFRWENDCYRKVSPLLAVNEATGAQRLVPRAAVVDLIDGAPSRPAPAQSPLKADKVAAAFETHLENCRRAVSAQDLPPAARDLLRAAMDESATTFRRELGLE